MTIHKCQLLGAIHLHIYELCRKIVAKLKFLALKFGNLTGGGKFVGKNFNKTL
jgi:hypothetical protein